MPVPASDPPSTRFWWISSHGLRDGDRHFYLNDLSREELRQVGGTTLAEIVQRNSSLTNVQDNVFFFHPTINGRVAMDGNANGWVEQREHSVGGVRLELHDATGETVATTRTRADGRYTFEVPELGRYTLHVVSPEGVIQATPVTVAVTSGDTVERVDIGIRGIAMPIDPPSRAPVARRSPSQPPLHGERESNLPQPMRPGEFALRHADALKSRDHEQSQQQPAPAARSQEGIRPLAADALGKRTLRGLTT